MERLTGPLRSRAEQYLVAALFRPRETWGANVSNGSKADLRLDGPLRVESGHQSGHDFKGDTVGSFGPNERFCLSCRIVDR